VAVEEVVLEPPLGVHQSQLMTEGMVVLVVVQLKLELLAQHHLLVKAMLVALEVTDLLLTLLVGVVAVLVRQGGLVLLEHRKKEALAELD
jgi:hypothetical protein